MRQIDGTYTVFKGNSLTKIYNLMKATKSRSSSNNEKVHEDKITYILNDAKRINFTNNDVKLSNN